MKNKKQKNASDKELLLKIFKKRKKLIATSFVLNIFLVLVSLAFVGMKFLYPYHFIIGVAIYALSYVPLAYRLYLSRNTFKKFSSYNFAKSYYANKKKRFLYGAIATVTVLSFFAIRPFGENAFSGLGNREIADLVDSDMKKSVLAMDYLEVSGENLLASIQAFDSSPTSSEKVRKDYGEFLKAVVFSESLTDVHRYFDEISISRAGEARAKSFMISYSLYAKKYEIVHRTMTVVSGNEAVKKILNENVDFLGRADVYQEMAFRYYEPKTMLRMNLGRAYLKIFYEDEGSTFGEDYMILQKKSKESYAFLFNNLDKTLSKSIEVSANQTESRMFDAWFPIQKNVANTMGHVVFMDRKDKGFISLDQILGMKNKMEPGDMMLQRRNWHLSNVGIPGFWTHAALYTGTLDDMEKYFAQLFPFEGYGNFTEYLEKNYPDVYEKYKSLDSEGRRFSVIEAIEPGVVAQSLEKSANADFVVVMRPRLEKRDKLLALSRAFENFGKPYDYDFDFETRDALVCSELVYDAYAPMDGVKKGISFKLNLVSGRKMVSPLNIAEKFKHERKNENKDLDFVYFLQGDESSKKAFVSTEDKFAESLDWSKFSFLQ